MQDEIFYVFFLCLHIAFGAFHLDKVPLPFRPFVCSFIGVCTSVLLMGWEFLHMILLSLATVAIIVAYRRTKKFNLTFVLNMVAFGHLLVFRLDSSNCFSNMIMMMLVLKMAGLGVELTAGAGSAQDAAVSEASVLDILHYAFSYPGLLAGPYIRFRTYFDFIHDVCPTTFEERKLFMTKRLAQLPYLVAMFLASSAFAPVGPAKTAGFYQRSGFLYTLWYMMAMFVGFRARLYIGFVLAECTCIAAGLGAYPTRWVNSSGEGPRDRNLHLENKSNRLYRHHNANDPISLRPIDFNTVTNVDIWSCETAPTIKTTMRAWNQTVQYWLAVNCHKRLPFRDRATRMAITLAVSAFWHGVRPGYYLCFVTMVFFVVAENQIVAFLRRHSLAVTASSNPVMCVILGQPKMAVFAYLTVAFIMSSLVQIFRFYWNVYFVGHFAVIVCILLFCRTSRSREHQET